MILTQIISLSLSVSISSNLVNYCLYPLLQCKQKLLAAAVMQDGFSCCRFTKMTFSFYVINDHIYRVTKASPPSAQCTAWQRVVFVNSGLGSEYEDYLMARDNGAQQRRTET